VFAAGGRLPPISGIDLWGNSPDQRRVSHFLGFGGMDWRWPWDFGLRQRVGWRVSVFTNLNTHTDKKPRLLGQLGDLSHTKVSSSDFKYTKDTEIFGQAKPVEFIYQVIEGAVRSHKLLSDGRRQIGAFHLPGDIFGFENGVLHRFTAEAIVDSTVRLVKRHCLERVAMNDPAMVRSLLNMTTHNLRHVENHLLLLGRQSARERVAAFLLEMNGRLKSAGAMALPMSRRDIADYLGLTIETVSRAISAYQRKGYLKVAGPFQRDIIVVNPVGLAELDRERLND
jgi:CRP/FNR family transcriptional regulator, nitrogen fixation regulation protein